MPTKNEAIIAWNEMMTSPNEYKKCGICLHFYYDKSGRPACKKSISNIISTIMDTCDEWEVHP